MARFGQGVMPQLGATDYTPFMQGSIRGSESVARGIEMLGQAAAQGVQQYYQKKEEKQLLTDTRGRVKQILSSNPAFAQGLGISDLNDDKAVDAAIKGIGGGDIRKGAAVTNQMLMQLSQQEQQAAAQAQRLSGLASSLERSGVPPAVVAAVRGGVPVEDAVKLVPARPDKALDPVSFRGQDAQGNPAEITVDRLTGQQISVGPVREQPRMIRTPDEEARAAYLAARAKDAAAFRSAIGAAARQGVESNDLIQRNIELLSSGDVKTGVGAEWIKNAKSAVNTLLGESAFDLGKEEEAARNFADFALAAAARMQKQGQITEGERKLLRDTVAQYGSSREGNLRILRVMLAINNRTAALNQHLNDIESAGGMPTEADAVKFYQENPLDAFFVVEEGGAQSPEAAPSPTAGKASAEDTAAMAWLQSNPNHPLAASVRARLTSRGLMP